MRYAIAIMLMLGLSFGLINESFRYQSTARLFEDDYDLLFDPARIPQIEGSRLWTSLSNFVTGNEQMFSNISAPYILIGGSTNLNQWYPGFVYDRRASKNPLYTGLDDPFGNQMYGEGTRSEIDWEDDDNNGVFDRRVTETESREAYDHIQVNDFYVGIGTVRNDKRFGIGYSRINYKNTATDPNDNLSWANEGIINGDSSLISRPNDSTTWFTGVTVLDSTDQPRSGMRIAVELKDFYDYNEYAQGRFYLRFFMENYDYADGAMSYYYNARSALRRFHLGYN